MRTILTLFLLTLICGSTRAQVEAGVPDDLVACDVNNPGDETEVFDLTTNEEQIINGQTDVVVTYHITSGAALGGINAIPNPESYQNISNPEPIWARLQSTAGQGWSVVSFQLFVPKIPVVATPPDNLFIDEGDGNAEAVFDLTVNQSQMLGGADPFEFQFSYFTSLADAESNENPIADPEAYTNVTNPQTIFGRYEYFITGCNLELFHFEIQTDGALGLTDNQTRKLVLWPNPATHGLTISGLDRGVNYSVQLLDISGRLISQSYSANQESLQLDVADLAPAVYLLRVAHGKQVLTSRFIRR